MSNAVTVYEDEDYRQPGMQLQRADATTTTAIQVMSAMIDKRIVTARNYPRSVTRFKKEATDLLKEDVETARSAEYAKPVGGGTVKGPSVRLAEVALLCWGNVEVEMSEPVVGDKSVSVKASAWDLERNIRQESVVTMSIVGKSGRYPQHMIETTGMAAASKARRNVICMVIPRAYINDLLKTAKTVANASEKPLKERRQDALDFIARTYKVKQDQVFAFLAVEGIEDITTDHLDDLRAAMTAIKDGESKVEDFFPAVESKGKADEIKRKIEERKNAAGTTSPPVSPPPAATATTAAKSQAKDILPDLIEAAETAGIDWLEFFGVNSYESIAELTALTGRDRTKAEFALQKAIETKTGKPVQLKAGDK